MSIVKVEYGVVVQKWMSKSLAVLQKQLPSADLRDADVVCGQIDNGDGTFRLPDPVVISESEAAQQALDETQGAVALIGEEVIEILLAKGVITISELKAESRALLDERKSNKAKVLGE